jgi:hypothetical protein
MNRVARAVSVAVFLSLTAAAPAVAASADELAIKNYTLTLDKVTRYLAANEAFEQAKKTDPSLVAEEEAADNEPSDTHAEIRAIAAKHPRLYSFFQRQGLSVDDIILLPQALIAAYGAIKSGQPELFADMTRPAQINFVRQNEAAISKFYEGLQK